MDKEVHYFPGGWSFFSSIITDGYFGAFFTTEFRHNIYHNSKDDSDLPITAILIPY